MKYNIMRLLVILCVVVILGGLALRSVAGPLCLSARSASGCQRCCQPETSSETEARVPTCSLFCCTRLPDALEVPVLPVLSLIVFLPGIHELSVCLPPTPPPPKSWLSIQGRCL